MPNVSQLPTACNQSTATRPNTINPPYPHPVRLVSVLASVLLSAMLISACGGGSSNSNSSPTPSPDPETPNNWQPTGGNATVPYQAGRPFLTLIPNLDINQISGVSQGRELFITNWTPAGTGRPLFDGLGGLFNAPSCTSCHAHDARVPPYDAIGNTTDGVLFRIGDREGNAHPIWGEQLQPKVIDNAVGLLAEASVSTHAHTDDQGRQYLSFSTTPYLTHESLGDYHLAARIAPQLVGMGLLDLISEADIIAHADPDDMDGNGISGRVHWVFEDGGKRVGRFGWKAINSSLRNQNANAMHQDMGLTTSIFPDGNCTPNQPKCTQIAVGGMPEVSDSSLAAVVDFMTALSVPARRINNQDNFDAGARLFDQVGCSQCHIPTMRTSVSTRFAELSNQTIYAYTDLLLHDMGAGLDDKVKEKNAESYEWRTPPLWGIGIVAQDPDARFLHDGRARTLDESIRWHGGEADGTRQNYQQLSQDQQALLLEFLQGI